MVISAGRSTPVRRCGELHTYRFAANGNFPLEKTALSSYKTCAAAEIFTAELVKLYTEQLIPAIQNGLCAAVLTQLSDVEDETNGIVTYDRQLIKPDEKAMIAIAEKISAAFNSRAT